MFPWPSVNHRTDWLTGFYRIVGGGTRAVSSISFAERLLGGSASFVGPSLTLRLGLCGCSTLSLWACLPILFWERLVAWGLWLVAFVGSIVPCSISSKEGSGFWTLGWPGLALALGWPGWGWGWAHTHAHSLPQTKL